MTKPRKIVQPGTSAEKAFLRASNDHRDGQLTQARVQLQALANEYPDDDRVIGKLGYVLYELAEHSAALDVFSHATEVAPEVELWSVGRFHALWKLEKFDEAFDEARRYLRVNPHSVEYARLLDDMGEELNVRKRGK